MTELKKSTNPIDRCGARILQPGFEAVFFQLGFQFLEGLLPTRPLPHQYSPLLKTHPCKSATITSPTISNCYNGIGKFLIYLQHLTTHNCSCWCELWTYLKNHRWSIWLDRIFQRLLLIKRSPSSLVIAHVIWKVWETLGLESPRFAVNMSIYQSVKNIQKPPSCPTYKNRVSDTNWWYSKPQCSAFQKQQVKCKRLGEFQFGGFLSQPCSSVICEVLLIVKLGEL